MHVYKTKTQVKASPGIHYIVVFRENVKATTVIEFLIDITVGKFKENIGNDDFMINKTSQELFSLLSEIFKKDFFVYAPHVDSTAGLIRELNNFKSERLSILKEESLCCVSINKIATKEYIKTNLWPNIKKERKIPLNFINDSDYHGGPGEEVGSGYFLLEKTKKDMGFQEILFALTTQNDIKTFLDIAHERYKNFVKNQHIIKMNVGKGMEYDEPLLDEFCRNACAILNSDTGFVEFEINTHGIDDPKESINKIIKELLEVLNKRLKYVPGGGSVIRFPISKNKEIVLFRFIKSKRLVLFENICFTFNKNNQLIIADANEVEYIVSKKMFNRFGKSKDRAINTIAENAYKVKNSLIAFSIASKNDNFIVPYRDFKIEMLPMNKVTEEIKETVQNSSNGVPDGKYIAFFKGENDIKGGRYESSYLRVTAPTYNLKNIEDGNLGADAEKNSILITINGATYICQDNVKIITEYPCFKFVITNKELNPYDVLGYFKSCFLEWYLIKVLDYDDLFDFFLATKQKKFPFIKGIIENQSNIHQYVHNIILAENKFLKEYVKIFMKKDHKDENLKLINRHNAECDRMMGYIDKEMFSLLDIPKYEISKIFEHLKELNIYDYNSSNNFEKIF